jgi:hypothetical protein
VEVSDTVSAAICRRDPIGFAVLSPAGPTGGKDTQWPGLLERERAVGDLLQSFLDAVELGVSLGIEGPDGPGRSR